MKELSIKPTPLPARREPKILKVSFLPEPSTVPAEFKVMYKDEVWFLDGGQWTTKAQVVESE